MEKYELTGLALQVTLGTVSCHVHMTIVKVAMEGWVVGNFAKCNVISLPRFSFWVNENKWLYQKQKLICSVFPKKVRWADIEERRSQVRMRDVGFIVGQTNWNRMMDPTGGGSALTKTKIIPNRFQIDKHQ